MARRKEVEEIERAAIQGRLIRKGKVTMRCQICGVIGHNKRFHGTTSTSGANPSNPNSEATPTISKFFSHKYFIVIF